MDSSHNTIAGNVISANRGYGIHALDDSAGSSTAIDLTIADNYIGTNQDGTLVRDGNSNSFGNGPMVSFWTREWRHHRRHIVKRVEAQGDLGK